jgi:transglutaminase-like putative cysteine protease
VSTRKWVGYSKAVGILSGMIVEGSHDPKVLDLAAKLVHDLGPMNYPAQAQALWLWVRKKILYLSDPYNEDVFQAPDLTMKRQAGDCDDQVILLGSLLRSIGFRVRLVFVFRDRPQNYATEFPEHVYLQVDVNQNSPEEYWVDCDTIPVPQGKQMALSPFGETLPVGFREYCEVG